MIKKKRLFNLRKRFIKWDMRMLLNLSLPFSLSFFSLPLLAIRTAVCPLMTSLVILNIKDVLYMNDLIPSSTHLIYSIVGLPL